MESFIRIIITIYNEKLTMVHVSTLFDFFGYKHAFFKNIVNNRYMSDFNIGQPINRFSGADYSHKSAKSSEGVGFQQPPPNVQNAPQQAPHRNLNQTLTQQANLMNSQLAQLNNIDKSILLKELFNLPQDIKDFLLMMTSSNTTKNVNPQELMTLLMNSNIDLSKLVLFMQQNGKEALSKLFQMVANFNQLGTSMKTAQMNELSAIINACIPTAGTSQTQTLKNILLLYLPWLPLGEQNGFELEIGNNGGEDGKQSDDSITILISTVNFGNVQVQLFKEPQKKINMQIACSKEFPKKEIEKEIQNEALNYNVQTGIVFEEKQTFSKEKQLTQNTQVSMNTSPGVNPFLILMAQAVIKTIIGIDKNYSLRETRKENLEK